MNEQYIIQQLNKAHKYMEDFIGNVDMIPLISDGIVQYNRKNYTIRLCIFLRTHIVIDYSVPLESITSYNNFLSMIKEIIKIDFTRRGIIK